MTATLTGWVPPTGSVHLSTGPTIRCDICGHIDHPTTPRAAAIMVRDHRCPPGTRGAVPICPICWSTTDHCRNPHTLTPRPTRHPARTTLAREALA